MSYLAFYFGKHFFSAEGILSVSVTPVFLCREGVEDFPALNEFCRGDCVLVIARLWSKVLRGEGDVFPYIFVHSDDWAQYF